MLVVGYDTEDELIVYVNDPGFNTSSYEYGSIVGWRIFEFASEMVAH